ncbi:major facilitator superfamily domain-containing protein [Podospora didyma]|uniref:Major facilitator superfamily domain-containing protein n=1 Tax=Podospora didyma TaxID=330526 RepID=A0AAE0U4F8_9PEZI|nr:major facilitator superfamily domain-containing protein [Podospora didyma]
MTTIQRDRSSGSASTSIVGSETGYPLHDENVGETRANEATSLLGAGASGDGKHDGPRKDSWVGLEDFEGFPWWKKPSVWWLLVPYALFTLAFGGSIVPKLQLIIDLICKRHFADQSASDPSFKFKPIVLGADNPQCSGDPEIQRIVATFTLLYSVLIGTLSSLSAPFLGALSDRYGRKRIMVICSAGGVVGEVIIILTAKYPEIVHYRWIILGGFFDGLAGSFTAGSVLSHSYASDCTPPSKRSVAIGYLHSCLFCGLAFGPLLAGQFVKWTGSLVSIFYVTLGCHIFFILFVWFVVPESLSKRRQHIAREKFAVEQEAMGPVPSWAATIAKHTPYGRFFTGFTRSWKAANPLAPLKILFPRGPGTAKLRRNLLAMAFIDFCIVGIAMSSGPVTILYTELMFHWGTIEASNFISLVYTVRVVVLMGIFPLINYVFRTQPEARRQRESGVPLVEKNAGADMLDIWILRVALVSDVVGVAGYIFARTSALFVACAIVTAFGGLGSATISASLSKHVPADRVGQILGAVGLLHAMSRIVAPAIFNGLYALTVKTFPQAFFVLLTGIFASALVASFFLRPNLFMEEDEEPARSSDAESSRSRQDDDDEFLPAILQESSKAMTTSTAASPTAAERSPIYFGPFEVTNQVFLKTTHSFALVNLKPLLPGHVLVCPVVPHKRLTDLSAPEVTDLFSAVQRVERMLARHYFFFSSPPSSSPSSYPFPSNEKPGGSFNIALQDGPEAGQTVAHVHVHVIPRIRGSTAKAAETPTDELYERMADEDGNVGGAQWDHHHSHNRGNNGRPQPGGKFPSIEDSARQARSMEEMEAEAEVFRNVLAEMKREETGVDGDGGNVRCNP